LKSIEELTTGTADVTAITPKVISAAIEEVARGARVMVPLFRENRDLVNREGLEISFPKKGTGIAFTWNVGPGNTVSPSSFAYDAETIRAVKVGGRLALQTEALQSALRDVIKDQIYEAGLEYAETLDLKAWETLIGRRETTIAFSSAGTAAAGSASLPLVDIVSCSHTISSVDYATGTVILTGSIAAGTVVAGYASEVASSNRRSANGTITGKTFLQNRADVQGQNFNPDFAVMHPMVLADLLYDSSTKFLEASAYPSGRDVIYNGEIGQVFGLRILVTSRIPRSCALLVDRKRMGYHVIKRDLESIREEKPDYDEVWYHLWAQENFGVVNSLAVGLVTYCTDDSVTPMSQTGY